MSISTVFVSGFGSTILTFELHIDFVNTSLSRLIYKKESHSEDCPSFIQIVDDKLYSVNEVNNFNGKESGGLTLFKIADDGTLSKIQTQLSGGQGPCHLNIILNKNSIYIANYNSGHFTVLKVDENGCFGSTLYSKCFEIGSKINLERQASSHPHGVYNKDNHIYVVDLGADKIWHFIHEKGFVSCDPILTPPGSGPRHMVFHEKYNLAFVLTELSNEILVYLFTCETGDLKLVSSYPFITDNITGENFGSEIAIHPNGEFLYLTNRVHGAIISFRILDSTGNLERIEHYPTAGTWPRHFAIHPSGKIVLCADQFKNIVEVIAVDSATGKLKQIEIVECKNQPSCIGFKGD